MLLLLRGVGEKEKGGGIRSNRDTHWGSLLHSTPAGHPQGAVVAR